MKRINIFFLIIFLFSCDTRHVYYTYQGLPEDEPETPADISEYIENLTDSPQDELHPRFSPDSKEIVFTKSQQNNSEIYIMNVTGASTNNITRTENAIEQTPFFSPDGNKIVYISNKTGVFNVHVMDKSGSNPLNLTNGTDNEISPVYSPDGGTIMFLRISGRENGIHIMNPDGTNLRLLTQNNTIRNPVFSPDGFYITFTALGENSQDVMIMKADGGEQRNLSQNIFDEMSPVFLPNSKEICYAVISGLFIMDINGRNIKRLTSGTGSPVYPEFSPDGNLVLYLDIDNYNNTLYLARVDNAIQPLKLKDSVVNGPFHHFSPNGNLVVFSSAVNGNYEIYILNLKDIQDTLYPHQNAKRSLKQ